MRTPTKQGIQVLRRTRDFLKATEVTVALGPISNHIDHLAGVIDRLTAHAVEQDNANRAYRASARAAQELSRGVRQKYLRPVAQLGRALFPNDPVVQQALAMPDARDYQRVIAAALAMAAQAEEHKDQFVKAGFGEDFVEKMRKVAEELRVGVDTRAANLGRRTAATAGLLLEMARGRDLIRLLDAMVAPELAGVEDKMAQWRSLTRFVRVGQVSDEETPAPTPAPVTPPPAPTETAPPTSGEVKLDQAA